VTTRAPSILDGLSDSDRRAVLEHATRRRYCKGEVLFHAGDRGDTVHLIDKVHVAIRATTPDGDVATFMVLRPGDIFGEQALIDPEAIRLASAVALDAVETRTLSRDRFTDLRDTHPVVDRFLLDVMLATVRRLNGQLLEALYVAADPRVLRTVVWLARDYGGADEPVIVPLTQDDIASIAGAARATTNRVLRKAQADGLLLIARGRLEIPDLDRLTKCAR
jgi:CRP-like cAMP-binding protein